MSIKQYEVFGKSVLVMIWFYFVSLFGSYCIRLFVNAPNVFLKEHGNLYTLFIYGVIFMGVYGTSKDRSAFHEALKMPPLKIAWREISLYMVMGIGVYVVSLGINHVCFRFFADYAQIQEGFNGHEPILRFLAMVIAPAFVEEYLFRFKIQNWMKEGFGIAIAIVGQALLFGLLHNYTLQKIYAIVCGLYFGVIKEKKGIKATLWMHLTVNGIGWVVGSFLL